MRLKTYFVDAIEGAMQRARGECGPDAMLVYSKRTGPETAHLGAYEVVFATPAPGGASPALPPPPPPMPRSPIKETPISLHLPDRPGADKTGGSEVPPLSSGIVRELRQLSRMLDAPPQSELSVPAEIRRHLDLLHDYLHDRGIEPELCQELTAACGPELMRRRMRNEPAVAEALLRGHMIAKVSQGRETVRKAPRVIALIGPPGGGKTTTLAKIAVQEGLAKGVQTRIIDNDTVRIGGGEHLRSIASLLNVRYDRVSEANRIGDLLTSTSGPGLVLVDTPGFSQREDAEVRKLAEGLPAFPGLERHLVLPATLRSAELTQRYQLFSECRPTHLLFTQTDETLLFGAAWSLAARANLRMSWFGTGSGIPEDLNLASAELLVDWTCQGHAGSARAIVPATLRASAATVAGSPSLARSPLPNPARELR